MRRDVLELRQFYASDLGRAARAMVARKVAEAWGGFIDSTPDARPVISAVDKLPGFFIAAGFSGHGFGLGPGAGRLAADLIAGDAPAVDPHAFRYTRFTDGAKLRPSSWV